MTHNVGGWDRNSRFIVGGAAVAAALLGRMSLPWRIGALALAASELTTATTRYCPMNRMLGINTAPVEAEMPAMDKVEELSHPPRPIPEPMLE